MADDRKKTSDILSDPSFVWRSDTVLGPDKGQSAGSGCQAWDTSVHHLYITQEILAFYEVTGTLNTGKGWVVS